MKTRNLATVNNVSIQIVDENNEKSVPIKPICEAIGVNFEGQRQRIERDEILSSVAFMTKATGSDGVGINYQKMRLLFSKCIFQFNKSKFAAKINNYH